MQSKLKNQTRWSFFFNSGQFFISLLVKVSLGDFEPCKRKHNAMYIRHTHCSISVCFIYMYTTMYRCVFLDWTLEAFPIRFVYVSFTSDYSVTYPLKSGTTRLLSDFFPFPREVFSQIFDFFELVKFWSIIYDRHRSAVGKSVVMYTIRDHHLCGCIFFFHLFPEYNGNENRANYRNERTLIALVHFLILQSGWSRYTSKKNITNVWIYWNSGVK